MLVASILNRCIIFWIGFWTLDDREFSDVAFDTEVADLLGANAAKVHNIIWWPS